MRGKEKQGEKKAIKKLLMKRLRVKKGERKECENVRE